MSARYLGKRLLASIVTLWITITVVFVLFHAVPGNPVDVLVSPFADPASRAVVIHQLGLDKPVFVQYLIYLKDLVQGRLGTSFIQRQPVLGLIEPAFANTFVLALTTFVLAYFFGGVLGALAGWTRGSRGERVGNVVVLLLRGAPTFWLGVLAIIVFGLNLKWFPVAGISSKSPWPTGLELYLSTDFLRHLALPLLTSFLYAIGLPLILMRNSILDALHEDFVDLARAKGIGEWRVLFLHGARNALLPLLAESAQFLGWAMGGLVTIEYVFSWPGLGYQLVTALATRDYPLGQGCFVAIAVMVIGMNLIADIAAVYVDPRVTFG